MEGEEERGSLSIFQNLCVLLVYIILNTIIIHNTIKNDPIILHMTEKDM